jgi:hypothetical protein
MCYREVKEIEEYRAVERAELRDAVNAQKRPSKAWDLRWIVACHLLSILLITLMPF